MARTDAVALLLFPYTTYYAFISAHYALIGPLGF